MGKVGILNVRAGDTVFDLSIALWLESASSL